MTVQMSFSGRQMCLSSFNTCRLNQVINCHSSIFEVFWNNEALHLKCK